MGKLKD
jgi:hypothetical protein